MLYSESDEVKRGEMKTYCLLVGLLAGFLIGFPVLANAQSAAPLQLVQTISMPNVKGRIDHMDVDVKGKRLFVAGLENGSLEVVDLQGSICGLANG